MDSYQDRKLDILNTAKRYSTRWGFGSNKNNDYQFALKYGFLDEACSHMVPNNFQEKYLYTATLGSKIYIGISKNVQQRLWKHKNNPIITTRNLFRNSKTKITIRGPFHTIAAMKLEQEEIKKYKLKNYRVLNIRKGGDVGSVKIKWNLKSLEKIVRGKSTSQILPKYWGAYRALLRHPQREYLLSIMNKLINRV